LTQEANCPTFINADLIAAGLSSFEPEKAAMRAGRLMLQTMNATVAGKKSFSVKTTLAGIGCMRKIPQWRSLGYRVSLIFLKLNSVDIAIDRVAERVRQGGHDIPELVIRRRFTVGLRNFQTIYSKLVDEWTVFDNSSSQSKLLDWDEDYE